MTRTSVDAGLLATGAAEVVFVVDGVEGVEAGVLEADLGAGWNSAMASPTAAN